eukprot:2369501-Alexandrium_andersonii.AAC.1
MWDRTLRQVKRHWNKGRAILGMDANCRVGHGVEPGLVGGNTYGETNQRGWKLRTFVHQMEGAFLNTF